MKKIFSALGGSWILSSLYCLPAFSLPFKPNPDSFAFYANNLNWGRGENRYFYNLDRCEYSPPGYYDGGYPKIEQYTCRSGYVNISNPMGSQICSLDNITFVYSKAQYRTNGCRYTR